MTSLSRMKSIITQMKIQITPNICSSFFNELSVLNQQHQDNASLIALFNMMQSLGKYLNIRTNKAHTEAVPVLQSIADIADTIIQKPDLALQKKQQMVTKQIALYKRLQNKLSSTPAVNPADIQDLKAVILAIDWEISDQTISNFEAELNRQLVIFSPYSIHRTFLRIILSTGRYVAAQKAKADTNSIFFLRSVFENFERLIESPDMLFKDKKELLEKDIRRFHEFRLKISKKTFPDPTPVQDMNEESIAPALSHIKSSSNKSPGHDSVSSLTALEIDELPENIDPQNMTPALSGKKAPKDEPRDVMGDLFSIKESPADELLDAIHLLDVHGSNPDQAMTMLDSSDDLKSQGIEKHTPQRIDTDPIPEIDDRLDAFFNLDTNDSPPEKSIEPPPSQSNIEIETTTNEGAIEGVVPFVQEDETEDSIEEDVPEPMLRETLERLKSYFKSFDSMVDESWYVLVQEDISFLKKHWQTNADKLTLLDILDSVLLLLDNQIKKTQDDTQVVTVTQKGFWQKIKAIFSS